MEIGTKLGHYEILVPLNTRRWPLIGNENLSGS